MLASIQSILLLAVQAFAAWGQLVRKLTRASVGSPPDHLLADPDNVLYAALGMRKDLSSTFFNIAARVLTCRVCDSAGCMQGSARCRSLVYVCMCVCAA